MSKKRYPTAMNDMGEPSEVGSIDSVNPDDVTPFVEVTESQDSNEPMEITKPSNLTSI